MTSIKCISAGDWILDPFYIFEGKSITHTSREQLNADGSLRCFDKSNRWTVADKGYLTDKIWEEEVVPDLVSQINRRRVYMNLQQQWVQLVCDGSHAYSTKALKMLLDNKIKTERMPYH